MEQRSMREGGFEPPTNGLSSRDSSTELLSLAEGGRVELPRPLSSLVFKTSSVANLIAPPTVVNRHNVSYSDDLDKEESSYPIHNTVNAPP